MRKTIEKFINLPRDMMAKHPRLRLVTIPVMLVLGVGICYAVQLITLGGPLNTLGWMLRHPGPSAFTSITLALIITVLWALTGSTFAASLITMIPSLALAFINYFKVRINSSPLQISDFELAKNLPELAELSKGNLFMPLRGIAAISGCVLLLLAALWLDRALRHCPKQRFWTGSAALVLFLFFLLPGQDISMRFFGMKPESRIGQTYSCQVNGLMAGLFRSWALQDGTAPRGYDSDYMNSLLDDIRNESDEGAEGEKPSVILVLSESFFDLTSLPDVEFSADPLPVFHSLSENTVSGTFHTSYCGFNTGIIERSVLTGLHSRYFPYGVNVCYMSPEDSQRLTALPQLFRQSGYRTLALHTYTNELYSREDVFPLLGFDRVLFQDDFYDGSRTAGGYLSDDYLADLIISNYEDMTAEGAPAFVFGISMENHQPYPADKFDSPQISVSSPLLSAGEEAVMATLAQGIYDADASLGKLVDYFSRREDPVILVFFGDHRPSLPTADGGSIYQKLGLCPVPDDFFMSPEETAVMYSTDYLVWANYDAFDEADFHENIRSGDVKLGSDILDWAGIPRTLYWELVRRLSETTVLFTENSFVDAKGNPGRQPTAEALPYIRRMEDVIYDTFYGERYITDALNEIR